ncbi:MAG: oligosaccharide flippase family protein [Phormidium sp.]
MDRNLSSVPESSKNSAPSRRLASGTIQVFLAEALLLPTGLLTAAFLTRQLGPESYGLLLLATTLVSWVGWSITSAFTRATIKFIGETEDWQSVATTVLQLHLFLGLSAAAILWFVADPVANALGEPQLKNYLRLLIFEVPIFCVTYVHRSVLVGLGKFSERAIATATRWIVRMILTIALVAAGLSIWGAIIGSLSGVLIEFLICRFYVRPPLLKRSPFPVKNLWGYAVPLFLMAISLRLYDKLDLFMLKLLGGTAAETGYYGTAQNLSLVPGLFTLAFVPLLLSTLTRLLRESELKKAQELSKNAMRLVLLLLPFSALAAGAASEIIKLLFSTTFLPAAPLFSILIFAAVAMAIIAITTAILTAASKPNWTIALTGPMVPLAIAADLWMIPKFGALGAAVVTITVSSLGALATILAVYYLWQIFPSLLSFGRNLLIGGLVYGLARIWETPGWLLVVKLVVLGLLIILGLLLLGEFSAQEIAVARSVLKRFANKIVQSH